MKSDRCLHSRCSDARLTLITDSTDPSLTKLAVTNNKTISINTHTKLRLATKTHIKQQ